MSELSTAAAAGVKAMAGQSGNAAGVAVLGALFFGLLGGNADAAAGHDLPRFRAQLKHLGVSAPAATALERSLTECFTDQSRASDHSTPPPSCRTLADRARTAGDPAVPRLVHTTLSTTRQQHFSDSLRTSLGYEVAVYAPVFLLVFLLPLRRISPGSRR